MVEKRTIKISVAVMAIAALVMGLSIGLGQKNKNEKTSSASSLNTYQTYCETGIAAGPGGGKAGKASTPTAPTAKAEKTVVRRELIVPGTEDAAVALGSGKRRMMKEELLRGIKQRQLKSSKGGCGGGKSGKARGDCPGAAAQIECTPLIEIECIASTEGGGKSGKSGPTSPSEGKSGKSGPTSPSEGKSGKSGPTSPSEGKSGKSGPTSPSEGKSGKSGPTEGKAGKASGPQSPTVCETGISAAGKSGKSGPTAPSCGKSGKSNGSGGDDCGSVPTTVTTASEDGFSFETPAPSPLVSAGSSETVAASAVSEETQGDREDPWAP